MILATATRNGVLVRDAIYVQADSAQPVHCFGCYTDNDKTTGAPTNGNHDKLILTSATATQLIGPPPTNSYKTIEFMSFRAPISNTIPVTVVVQVYDLVNSTAYQVHSAQLSAGETLWYHKAAGWTKSTASGSPPTFNDLVAQFIAELRANFATLGQADVLPTA